MKPGCQLDHLVVTAPSLAAGVDYVGGLLGVAPRPGGKHPRMGTHNSLLKLGPATYLEVIAVDPEAEVPYVPRWFQLDRSGAAAPRLATWVARTGAIRAAAACSPAFGRIEPMERGALRWEITLPEQGGLPFDGIAPTLIQWRTEPHPAALLAESGCTLVGLEGFHPRAAEVSQVLEAIGFRGGFRVSPVAEGQRARLIAHIQTPAGLQIMG
jgi:hypothetical protein